MKNRTKLIKNIVILIATIFLSLSFSCEKNDNMMITPTIQRGVIQDISLIGLKSDGGYSYKLGYNLPIFGDEENNPYSSTLILYENGVELSPGHANHQSIRDYGQGQYSDWKTTLYFSTSDNTNPLDNGRKYTFIIK